MYRGLKKNKNYTWLICAAQNMKTIAIKNDNVGKKPYKEWKNTNNNDQNDWIIENILNFIKTFFNLFYKENLGY